MNDAIHIHRPPKLHYVSYNRRALKATRKFDAILSKAPRCKSTFSCGRGNNESTAMEPCKAVEYFQDYYGWTQVVYFACPQCHRVTLIKWESG